MKFMWGKAIDVLRGSRSMTAKDVADAASLTESYISFIRAGKKQPSLKAVEAIAKALHVPPFVFVAVAEGVDSDLIHRIAGRYIIKAMRETEELSQQGQKLLDSVGIGYD